MTPYLEQVAKHYFQEGNLQDKCFIFPNRRTIAFFTKALTDLVRDFSSVPVRLPAMYTINDFFYKIYDVPVTDRVTLLIKLYDCYKELYPNAEPLDEFIFWGDVILGDFSDVDKYLAKPEHLFQNIAEFKQMQDDYSYLTPQQKEAIERFVGHFAEGKLTANISSGKKNVKENFLQIWNILYPLYQNFNETLEVEGLAYDGMVYRGIATRMKDTSCRDVLEEILPNVKKYIFVGLNALNECEKLVLDKMRDSSMAEFCWDYSSEMIKDRHNMSSVFMHENVVRYKPAFEPDPEGLPKTRFHVISVPSSVAQAKQVPKIIEGEDPEQCAIVLPDESLLIPLLNSIPETIEDINVTMGYPMSSSAILSLMETVSTMQLHLRNKGGRWYFYHPQVKAVFSSDLFRRSIGESGEEIVKKILEAARFYIPVEDLTGHPVFDVVFRPVVTDLKAADRMQTDALCDYLMGVVSCIAERVKEDESLGMEVEFARKYYQDVQMLKENHLGVLPVTLVRLLGQILRAESVPFEGEPLKGLQVMGPLETRALDFKNLVILSCNEGVFPSKRVSSSFVPPELRKGFGLPTYEFQDAVWAYYFYRMICRADNVWMLYDSRTEGVKNGEESRYIKQLQYHFGVDIKRYYAQAEASVTSVPQVIPKTEEDVSIIRDANLSASSLKNYLDCPAKFYYHTVKKLKPEEEVTEDLDASMIGNVYHKTMQALYLGPDAMDPAFDMSDENLKGRDPMGTVTYEYVKSWMNSKDKLKNRVRSLILSELHALEVTGRNLVVEEVIVSYVKQTLKRELEHMDELGVKSFEILGLEKPYNWELDGFKFFGFVDRVDSFAPGTVRVVDYKTGKVEKKDLDITDDNAESIVDALFGHGNEGRPKIAFQLFLYDKFIGDNPKYRNRNLRLSNSIYPPARFFKEGVVDTPVSSVFSEKVTEKLSGLLKEMTSLEIGFARTDQEKTCTYCDFRTICGR